VDDIMKLVMAELNKGGQENEPINDPEPEDDIA
jgi:hypothetical protein